MRRKEAVAALIAGAMIVLALMAVFAVELSDNQAQSRSALESTAHQRAQLVAGLLDTVFQATSQPNAVALAAYGAPRVSDRLLEANRGANRFVALLDLQGRVLAHSRGFTGQAAATIAAPGAVAQVRRGQAWALGNVRRYGKLGVIDFATLLHTAAGPRILLTGFAPQALEGFIASELRKIPGVQGNYSSAIDGNGVVIASTNPQHPAGYVFHTSTQLQALRRSHGTITGSAGTRYFDQVSLGNTSWKIVLSAPAGTFFASVSGARHYLPWVIFVAFGIVALGSLLLVRRSFRDAERVGAANDKLTGANAELADAKLRLEQVNDALADSNRALERSNEELERQARELVRSNTELDQFASIASHDLQEPLRKVRTFTERISETEADRLSQRGLDYLRRANSSAERMQTLIEDLLRYSRVSTQARPFTAVDLDAVAADVLEDLSDQVNRAGAVVTIGTLPTINADAPQMRQLLQNLISNAIKFRREGVVATVDVTATVQSGWVTVTVRDNGIGFDPQYSQRIFRVFERLHGRGTYPGTGIGLALCRKIAERHGGTIAAGSVPDQGSTFTVTMQTQRTEAVSDAPPPPPDDVTSGHPATEAPYVAA